MEVSPSLLDLIPFKVPLDNILQHAEYKSILTMRKVCHDLRNYIDDTKPDLKLKSIQIGYSYVSEISLTLDPKTDEEEKKFVIMEKPFINAEILNGTSKLEKDLRNILMLQSSPLDCFRICNLQYHMREADERRLLDFISSLLTSKIRPLEAKEFGISANHEYQVLPILKNIQGVEKIVIIGRNHGEFLDISRIVQLPQWKQIKNITIATCIIETDWRNIVHFERCRLGIRLKWQDIIGLKQNFLEKPHFKRMHLQIQWVSEVPITFQMVRDHLGEPVFNIAPDEDNGYFFYSDPVVARQLIRIDIDEHVQKWIFERISISEIDETLIRYVDNPPIVF